MLSNIELVREFVRCSIQKQEVLLANQALTAETVYKSNQILAKKEGVIASFPLNHSSPEFAIKADSSHWDVMNEALANYSYMLTGDLDNRGYYRYQYCQLPKGYQMHCTRSVFLWRAWWRYRKCAFQLGIPLELLIRRRGSWYPVKDLVISDGLLYIKTLGTEIAIHSDDLVIWLNKVDFNAQMALLTET